LDRAGPARSNGGLGVTSTGRKVFYRRTNVYIPKNVVLIYLSIMVPGPVPGTRYSTVLVSGFNIFWTVAVALAWRGGLAFRILKKKAI
jgi:hypothetical protein